MTIQFAHMDIEDSDGPKYKAIADALAQAVTDGALAPGDRLPTHRKLADTLGVTVGTVTRAYQEATRRGLVEGHVGRGTFVRDRSRRTSSFGAVEPDDDGLIRLGLNVPAWLDGDIEGEALARSLEELVREGGLAPLMRFYGARGSDFQREAGVKLASRVGLESDPATVVVTAGGQHGLTVALAALTSCGDRVLTESLTYPGLKSAARVLGLRLGSLAMDEEGVVPEAFEEACAAGDARAAYLIPTLQNPTNGTLSLERRQALAGIAQEHDITIIEDDVHGLLAEDPSPPIATFAPEHVCYVQSVGKVFAPGLRTGFVHAPGRLTDRLLSGVRTTMWMAAPLMAEITARWVRDGTGERLIEARRAESRERHALAEELLEGLEFRGHPASLHVWLKLPPPWRASDFVEQLAQRGVVVASAEAFAACRDQVPHAVRVGLSPARSRSELRKALTTIRGLLTSAGDPMLTVI